MLTMEPFGSDAMGLLTGKHAIITGGAGGIGAACARRFAQEGATFLFIVDMNKALADEVAADIEASFGACCTAVQADVSNGADIKNVFCEYQACQERLDILLNCAGIGRAIGLEDITAESWDMTMQVNLRAAFFFAREALTMMKPFRYGRIVNMASQAGKSGGIMIGMDYSASKGGLLTLTRSLAKAAAPYNITVNSVAPGLVETDMTTSFGYDPTTVPLGRIAVPEEIADVTLFAASDLSRYMTGACLDVNGGISMW